MSNKKGHDISPVSHLSLFLPLIAQQRIKIQFAAMCTISPFPFILMSHFYISSMKNIIHAVLQYKYLQYFD